MALKNIEGNEVVYPIKPKTLPAMQFFPMRYPLKVFCHSLWTKPLTDMYLKSNIHPHCLYSVFVAFSYIFEELHYFLFTHQFTLRLHRDIFDVEQTGKPDVYVTLFCCLHGMT